MMTVSSFSNEELRHMAHMLYCEGLVQEGWHRGDLEKLIEEMRPGAQFPLCEPGVCRAKEEVN